MKITKKLIKGKINKEIEKLKDKILKMKKLKDYKGTYKLSDEPVLEEEISKTLNHMKTLDYKKSFEGKTSGNYYFEKDQKHISFLKEVSKDFMFINPLHFSESFGTVQLQTELISFMSNLFNGGTNATGTITSGGTESIFVGMYTLRECGRQMGITKPNIISSKTAHPAMTKACYYLGIETILLDHNFDTGILDLKKVAKKIDENTIAIYMSGINYPHGIVDDVQWMNNFLLGKNAKTGKIDISIKKKYEHVAIYVDSCLGGFITSISSHLNDGRFSPVDFRLEKVQMISCDPHKYAMSPKGCSVLLFKNIELKVTSVYKSADWPGGIYGTPGFGGSTPSNALVGAWASLKKLGMNGMVQNYKKITSIVDKFKKDIESIPELRMIGDPLGCSIAFTFSKKMGKKFNIIILNEILKKINKWGLGISNSPLAIRISVTRNNCDNINQFLIKDLKTAIEMYKNNYEEHHDEKSDNMVFYGEVLNLPGNLSDKIIGYLMGFLMVPNLKDQKEE